MRHRRIRHERVWAEQRSPDITWPSAGLAGRLDLTQETISKL